MSMRTIPNPGKAAAQSLLVWLSYLGYLVKLESGSNPLKDTHYSEVGWACVNDCWHSYTEDEPLDWWQQAFSPRDLPEFYNRNQKVILQGLRSVVATRNFPQDREALALVLSIPFLGVDIACLTH